MLKLFITLLSIWLAAYVFASAAEQVIKCVIERRRRAQALAQRERHNKRVMKAIKRNRAEYYAKEFSREYDTIHIKAQVNAINDYYKNMFELFGGERKNIFILTGDTDNESQTI